MHPSRRALLLLALPAPVLAQAPQFTDQDFAAPGAGSTDRAGEFLDLDATHLAVGIPQRPVAGVSSVGVVAIWPRAGSTFDPPVLLDAPVAGGGRFGQSVVLDSGELVVAEERTPIFGTPTRSAVHRYERVGATWSLVDSIENPGFASANRFGLAMDRDGDLLAIGAPNETTMGATGGAVYLYRLVGGAWIAEDMLVPSDGATGDTFGQAVAVSGDRVLVGAPRKRNGSVIEGAAYAFERAGATWSETARLSIDAGSGDTGFGQSVDVDGDVAVVGAARTNDVGAAYVFLDSGPSWALEQRLQPELLTSFATFGHSVSLEGDELVVGAYQDSVVSFGSGAAWVFRRSATGWEPRVRLVGTPPTGFFGFTVVSDGAGTVVVGEPVGTADGAPTSSGAVHVVEPSEPIGTPYCAAVPNSTGNAGRLAVFGSTVAADDDVTLVGYELPQSAFGFFLTSATQGLANQPGGSEGVLCLGGAIGRYVGPGQILNAGAVGLFTLELDVAQTPTPTGFVTVAAGETWNFQAWHRDVVNTNATSNFTEAVTVVFQ
ncbi:MAG: FG-GAP repeat protein [Planctomycetota bacterium]